MTVLIPLIHHFSKRNIIPFKVQAPLEVTLSGVSLVLPTQILLLVGLQAGQTQAASLGCGFVILIGVNVQFVQIPRFVKRY